MQVTIDTNNITELDKAMLAFLASIDAEEATEEEVAPEPPKAAKAPAAKKAAAPKAAEPVAEEVEEDLLGGDGPTMADAVSAATAMVSNGKSAEVKTALAAVGAKRVSEIDESKIAEFLEALNA